jgi:SNF2 family DNA or RNA helicase
MEPQWNPTVEEQALARVHRLGQTKKVTTVRFIMKNSIEDVGCPKK